MQGTFALSKRAKNGGIYYINISLMIILKLNGRQVSI